MEISKRQAIEIVNTLKTIIQEDINFIAPDGYIIASSIESRIGDLHEGALVVAQTKMPLIISSDDEFKGARKGINLPVFYEQNLVAVVGITGEANEIIQFSKVIVKMSEILIKEHFLNVQKQFKRENNRVIIELLMNSKFSPEVVLTKMEVLGYDANIYHYLVVFDLLDDSTHNVELLNTIYNSIEKRIEFKDLLARHETKYIILSSESTLSSLLDLIKSTKTYIETKYKIRITVGISEEMYGVAGFYTGFKQADMVVETGTNKGSGIIRQFDGSSLDLLFKGFASYVHIDFSSSILKNMDKEERKETKELLMAYIRNNGSVMHASDELFIHKNTLQYRLNKIHQKTGYNPRDFEDLISLYIAIQLEKND
jgi:carbohydrate diacid regulator